MASHFHDYEELQRSAAKMTSDLFEQQRWARIVCFFSSSFFLNIECFLCRLVAEKETRIIKLEGKSACLDMCACVHVSISLYIIVHYCISYLSSPIGLRGDKGA